jgi:hypothetical protein
MSIVKFCEKLAKYSGWELIEGKKSIVIEWFCNVDEKSTNISS